MTIDTRTIAGDTIALLDSLPLIFNSTTIGGSGSLTIDGGGAPPFPRLRLPAACRTSWTDWSHRTDRSTPPDPDGAQASP